jgi:hypothetical protein
VPRIECLALGHHRSQNACVLVGRAVVFVVARGVHVVAIFTRRLLPRQLAHGVSTLVHLGLAGAIGWALWQAS